MDKPSDKKGILSSAGVLALAAILVKLIGLVYKIPMSHLLGDEGMGYFNAAYTIYSFLYLLGSAGVPKAITLLVSESAAKGDEEEAFHIFLVARRFFFFLGVVLFLFLFVFARTISNFIGSPSAYMTVLLISPCLLFVSVGGVYRGYLGARESFSPSAVASVLEGGLKLLLGLGFVFLGEYLSFSLPYLSAISVLGITVGTLVSTLYLRANIDFRSDIFKQKQKRKGKNEIKKILKIALPITLGSAAAGASSLVDLGMIMRCLEAGGMSTQDATAAYGNYTTLAVPMLQLVASLISPLAVVLLPRLSALQSKNREEDFISFLHFGMQTVAFFSVPISAVFLFFSQPLLSLIFSTESARIAAPLLQMLSGGVLLLSALFIVNTALEATGKVNVQMLSMLLGIAVKIPITYVLLKNPNVGILAAPIGTIFSYAASLIFSSCFLKNTDLLFSMFFAHMLPFINSVLASFAAILVFRMLGFSVNAVPKTLFVFFTFSAVYLISSFFTGVLEGFKKQKTSK